MADDRLTPEIEKLVFALERAAMREADSPESELRTIECDAARASLVSAVLAWGRQEREMGREEAARGPDDFPWLEHAIECCDAWEPEARLIGNVPAKALGDMLRALREISDPALSSPPSPAPAEKNDPHYGRDCPRGMVQVEFVGCPPAARMSDYGWKPTERAFLEVWVDGRRFRIDVGDFHDGREQRRGLHIVTDLGVGFEQTAMNTASLYLPAPAEKETDRE